MLFAALLLTACSAGDVPSAAYHRNVYCHHENGQRFELRSMSWQRTRIYTDDDRMQGWVCVEYNPFPEKVEEGAPE